MDSQHLAEKMQEVYDSLLKQYNHNELSPFSCLANSAKITLENFKAALSSEVDLSASIDAFKLHREKFEQALKQGKRGQARLALNSIHTAIDNLKGRLA